MIPVKEGPVHLTHYHRRREAKPEIFEYIEVFYNPKRLHSTIGYMALMEESPRARSWHSIRWD